MLRNLESEELDLVSAGVAPAAAIGVGAIAGAGAALIGEMNDGRPGVDLGNVVIGAAAGAGAAVGGLFGLGWGALGTTFFGGIAAQATNVNNSINDAQSRVDSEREPPPERSESGIVGSAGS